MSDILQIIAENKKAEIESFYDASKRKLLIDLAEKTIYKRGSRSMSSAIKMQNSKGYPGIIAEFKRRSPSKGDIAPMASVADVISQYDEGGVSGISVLTDTRFFGGSLTDLALARGKTNISILRKDFIIDEIQIFEAALYQADAILLIASILDRETLKNFTEAAHHNGLEVLYEIHDLKELEKMPGNVDMVGVNNRKLSSFETNVNHAEELFRHLPAEKVKVAESGMRDIKDVKKLFDVGFNGFLIGEMLMRAASPLDILKTLSPND